MPYAEGRTFLDADSHIMELPDFLSSHADPKFRDRLKPLAFGPGGNLGRRLERYATARAHEPEVVVELEQNVIAGAKGYEALGCLQPRRAHPGAGPARLPGAAGVHELLPGGLPVAQRPRRPLRRAAGPTTGAWPSSAPTIRGCSAWGWCPSTTPTGRSPSWTTPSTSACGRCGSRREPCGGRSPGHDDLDPFWARLSETGVPFVLHVGGQPLQIRSEYMNTGRPLPTDWLGGGENVRSKDITVLHHPVEEFLSAMVLDGVLERHPGLRGGAIELGAGWVPGLLRRLD